MNSSNFLRARYPEFLQTANPQTESVVAALDTVYSSTAPEQLRAQIAQLPRQPELGAGSPIANPPGIGRVDGKHARGAQLSPRRPRREVSAPRSKHVISTMTFTMVTALVLVLVLAAGSSLRRISPTTTNYGVGNTAQPTACELAASRFPGKVASAASQASYVMRVIPPSSATEGPMVTMTSRVTTPQYHDAYLSCSATPYRGTRVRLSADLKLDSRSASAGLNMVISSPLTFDDPNGPLRVDTMQDRAIKGSVGWRPYSVVLDVPEESTGFKFGPWLEGVGTLSIRDLRIVPVSRDVAVTNYTPHPRNLDFSHGEHAWFPVGTAPTVFTMSVQSHTAPGGGASLVIHSQVKNPQGVTTIVQGISAERYLGKRIHFSMELKTVRMMGLVQLWTLTDGPLRTEVRGNMQGSPISGTTAWRRYSIVLDVPRNSEAISFGIGLQGTGVVWMANGSLTTVDTSVPTT